MFVTQYEKSLEEPFRAAKKQAVSYAVMYAVSQAVIYVIYSVAFRYGAYLVEIGDMSATNVYRYLYDHRSQSSNFKFITLNLKQNKCLFTLECFLLCHFVPRLSGYRRRISRTIPELSKRLSGYFN